MNQAIRVGTCEEAESSIKEVIQPQVPYGYLVTTSPQS